MFVKTDERPFGEVTEAPKVLKLSDLVRQFGYENGGSCHKCVLACAYRGATGRELADDCGRAAGPLGGSRRFIQHAANTFGVSYEMADETETRCMNKIPPNEIADWLEAQGK